MSAFRSAPHLSTTVTREIRMFGDPITIDIRMNGSVVIGVSSRKGNERVRKLVQMVDNQIQAGRDILSQQWNVIALSELLWYLLETQDIQRGDAPFPSALLDAGEVGQGRPGNPSALTAPAPATSPAITP